MRGGTRSQQQHRNRIRNLANGTEPGGNKRRCRSVRLVMRHPFCSACARASAQRRAHCPRHDRQRIGSARPRQQPFLPHFATSSLLPSPFLFLERLLSSSPASQPPRSKFLAAPPPLPAGASVRFAISPAISGCGQSANLLAALSISSRPTAR
jgi:hypothetical protein